jgi:hypothetical protein
MVLTFISFGGGVNSVAMLVLAAQGVIPAKLCVFANTGDDSENPATLEYYHNIVEPYAHKHGIEMVEVGRAVRGEPRTLFQAITSDIRSIPIPIIMQTGKAGRRGCTGEYKIEVIDTYLKQIGVSNLYPATACVGIAVDEIRRLNNRRPSPYQIPSYPLIDLNIDRSGCVDIIRGAGLPIPEKSSCWFCQMKSKLDWQKMRANRPELFEQAIALEDRLNEKRAVMLRDPIYLSNWKMPLDLIPEIPETEHADDSTYDAGYCMT